MCTHIWSFFFYPGRNWRRNPAWPAPSFTSILRLSRLAPSPNYTHVLDFVRPSVAVSDLKGAPNCSLANVQLPASVHLSRQVRGGIFRAEATLRVLFLLGIYRHDTRCKLIKRKKHPIFAVCPFSASSTFHKFSKFHFWTTSCQMSHGQLDKSFPRPISNMKFLGPLHAKVPIDHSTKESQPI